MTTPQQKKASRAATALAVTCVLAVVVVCVAAFVPGVPRHGLTPAQAAGRYRLLDPKPPPAPSPSPSASASSATPAAQISPTGSLLYSPHPVAPPPVTYPAPATTYPAPQRTYPAPQPRTYPPPPPSPAPPPGADLPPPGQLVAPLEGVVSGDPAGFDAVTGTHVQLVASYVSMSAALAPSFLHSVMRVDGTATPVIEIEPATLAGFPSATDAAWLKALNDQIAALGRPVWVSFAPEADGSWYPWAQDPGGFILAWKQVRRAVTSPLVTWLWQMSCLGSASTANIMTYWPGASLVDVVGLDGYYYAPGDSFARRFGSVPRAGAPGTGTLGQVRATWAGPVIIAETAVSPLLNTTAAPHGQADAVTDLIQGVGANGLLGLIYFNLDACTQGCGAYKQDFRLESNPAALAAFTRGMGGAW